MVEHIVYLILIGLLIAATITDLKERLIYDRIIVIGVFSAILIRLFFRTQPWWNYLLTGVGVLIVLTIIAAVTNERSIGGGDVKLFAMIGLAVGWEPFILIFMLSHVLAALFMLIVKLFRWKNISKHSEFPFAPFILIGTGLSYSFFLLIH